MPARKSFKDDESFLEKISIGAIGTKYVMDLLKKQNHKPIELERGSTSFKIWKEIKIKRLRVPDILCVKCGRCVECRSKSKFEISMSHSLSEHKREWDYGLKDNDYVSFVVCEKVGKRPIDWKPVGLVQFVSVKDLRQAYDKKRVQITKPKGAKEGFERRLIWPSVIANNSGEIVEVSKNTIKYKRKGDDRLIVHKLKKKLKFDDETRRILKIDKSEMEISLTPLVKKGEKIQKYQVLASVVPVLKRIDCTRSVGLDYYINLIRSYSDIERLRGVKALAYIEVQKDEEDIIKNILLELLENDKEDILIRLEAAASLMKRGLVEGKEFIRKTIESYESLEIKLESVIILAEIASNESIAILRKVLLDENLHEEIRAGAAWALGEIRSKESINDLINCFVEMSPKIRIEAARALYKIATQYPMDLIKIFPKRSEVERPGIAWAISKSGAFSLEDILSILTDFDARQWAAYILGTQNPKRFIYNIEMLKKKDPEVYFATTVLWKILNSWIFNLEEYG